MVDIYFDENYGKLYEEIEQGKCTVFNYESKNGKIRNLFIKREVPISLNDGLRYFDLITPYGYGGPVILQCGYDRQILVREYVKSFGEYCEKENIVSEFIRFHPLVKNADDFRQVMDVEDIRYTIGTNLRISADPISSEFSKSCKKNIRRSLKNGVRYSIEEAPDSIQEFMTFYYKTMDRNNATEYYYFDEKYFANLVKYFKKILICVKVFWNGILIAMNICFAYGEYVHIHLSGTMTEYLHMHPTYILRYAICQWAFKNGYKLVHHGGGRSNADDDQLLGFKKQFGTNTRFKFSIAKNIWNKEVYEDLTRKHLNYDKKIESAFFPAYRR